MKAIHISHRRLYNRAALSLHCLPKLQNNFDELKKVINGLGIVSIICLILQFDRFEINQDSDWLTLK